MSILSGLKRLLALVPGNRKPAVANWGRAASDFAWDGGLRDIYVLGADTDDWRKLLDEIRETYSPVEFTVDGEAAAMPRGVAQLFEKRSEAGLLLRFRVGGIDLRCHFFDPCEIEFDLDPRSVDWTDSFEALTGFIRLLGDLSGKTVVLTPENMKEAPILRYAPGDADIMSLPPAG